MAHAILLAVITALTTIFTSAAVTLVNRIIDRFLPPTKPQ
jgi:hypothetical protein